MDVIIKLNNQSNGRDKLARLFQYTSRLVWHQLEARHADKYSIDRIRSLESTFSSFRKILRLGRCVDVMYMALDSTNIEDPWLRVSLTVSKLAHASFLYADHMVWLGKSGFLKTDSNDWNKTANKFWLISIIANLERDLYEIYHILELNKSVLFRPSVLMRQSSTNANTVNVKYILAMLSCHKDVFIDTFKNSCDLFIPLTALGVTKLSPSAIGVLGAASSLAALITIAKPITKLVPA